MKVSSKRTLLDPDAIASGENLGVLARSIVEGYRVGEHRSPFKGFAIEFAQHREYTVGDDLRHLDWKVLGRTDRHYIKQYEQDTNLTMHFLLDGSESMNYGSTRVTKLAYAKCLAACLAYLVLSQRDAISASVFDVDTKVSIRRTDSLGKLQHIMDRLAEFQATAKTSIGNAMAEACRTIRSRGIVVVLSDLFDDEEGFKRGLQQLRFAGQEVIVFHIMDPQEIEFTFSGRVQFIGLEGAPTIEVSPAEIRQSYLKEVQAMLKRMKRACEQVGCHYVLANTGHSLAETLSAYLVYRQRVCS